MLKSMIKTHLKRKGYELCKLYDNERDDLPRDSDFTFREAQWYRALANLGQLSLVEARALGRLVASSDPSRPIIEIGTLFGFSTLVMTMFKDPSQHLITVDNYSWNPLGLSPEAHYQLTRNRLKESTAEHRVEQRRQGKDEFYRAYDGPPPAVFFCDADHSYEATKADIAWAKSVGATIICGDDYDHPTQRGTAQAVDEFGGPRQLAGGLFVL
jgi:predicted O-methyltransferase YrrM